MSEPITERGLDVLFRTARTQNAWEDCDVPNLLMRQVYDLAKMGPTSANCSPARFAFLHTAEAKERLRPHLIEGNAQKTMAAPWTVIVAYDLEFYEKIPELFPHSPEARDWFSAPDAAAEHGFRNGSLQGAYLILAARALGLDCGPMSGFDNASVDKEFFAGAEDTRAWRSNFLCNIGYGDPAALFERSPRLAFETACKVW